LKPDTLSLRTLIVSSAVVLLVMFELPRLFPAAFSGLELKTVDSRFKLRDALGRGPIYSDSLVHINIDNYSKQASGEGLWPKTTYAELIDRIAEGAPEAVACDIMFVEWSDTAGNEELIEAVINAGNIVSPFLLALTADSQSGLSPSALALDINPEIEPGSVIHASGVRAMPLAGIIDQSAGLGFVNMAPDVDGVIRRVPMVAEFGGRLVPSFFLQALATYLDYELENVEAIDKSRIVLKRFPVGRDAALRDLTVPLDGEGNLIVNLAGPLDAQTYPQSYSAWDLMQSQSKADFSGKLVFLADISAQNSGYWDVSPVALERAFPRAYIWANAANSLLNSQFIIPTGRAVAMIVAIVLCALMVLAVLKFSTLVFSLVSFGSILIYIVIVYAGFVYSGWLLPLLPVVLSLVMVYIITSLYRYTQMEHYEGILEGSLESYLSPTLMNRIKDDPNLLKLGGKRKRITVMFSDIVNFTSFSDEADPQEVQEVLEAYFADAASIIFAENGIIDKYMGDGILAFFENEDGQMISPERAVRCAIAMQGRAVAMDRDYRAQNRFPFALRIGLATGYAKVGNIGPAQKIDYTVIGSVVNLASRLQGIGESGSIIIDDDTHFFVKAQFRISNLGTHALKGFSDPVQVYTVDDQVG